MRFTIIKLKINYGNDPPFAYGLEVELHFIKVFSRIIPQYACACIRAKVSDNGSFG